MGKSEYLDELRLEVGLAYDYAKSKDDFIRKVVCAIYDFIKDRIECSLFVYEVLENFNIHVKLTLGNNARKKDNGFGFGFINLIRNGAIVMLEHDSKQVLLVPIHENNCLKYIFKLEFYNYYYPFSTEDLDFINEVVRFVEVRQQRFIKDDQS